MIEIISSMFGDGENTQVTMTSNKASSKKCSLQQITITFYSSVCINLSESIERI